MSKTYDIGDKIRLSVRFSVAGVATDPTSCVLRVRDPLGLVTTPTAINDEVGKFHCDLSITASGSWWYRWEGTGAAEGAEEGEFFVRQSAFASA